MHKNASNLNTIAPLQPSKSDAGISLPVNVQHLVHVEWDEERKAYTVLKKQKKTQPKKSEHTLTQNKPNLTRVYLMFGIQQCHNLELCLHNNYRYISHIQHKCHHHNNTVMHHQQVLFIRLA